MPMQDLENRITELEIRSALQDDTIDVLNKQINELYEQLALQQKQLQSVQMALPLQAKRLRWVRMPMQQQQARLHWVQLQMPVRLLL